MKIRRVVTGHDASGASVVVSDEAVDGIRPALVRSETHKIWGADEAPRFPDDGSEPAQATYFPKAEGFRFGFFTVAPADDAPAAPPSDLEAAFRELEDHFPGMASHLEPEGAGMHTTATIDFVVVIEGEAWLELDNGVTTHLKAGDTLIQNGTRHAWRNFGTSPARLAVAMVGAHHATLRLP